MEDNETKFSTVLLDPTADYCKARAKIVRKLVKNLTKYWYRMFRCFGISAIDAIKMARQEVQRDVDKVDLTVNFDSPMQ